MTHPQWRLRSLRNSRVDFTAKRPKIDGLRKKRLGDWGHVARFAAYVCQSRSLKLAPWDLPPSAVSENDGSTVDAAAVALLRRMLKAGVSRYHPDPLAALARR
jgi:hypothetical protein